MSTDHPRLNDTEQIPVKKDTVEALQEHLWNEINNEDTPPRNLLEHWNELRHAQTRHETDNPDHTTPD
jgi:hypothetical protein